MNNIFKILLLVVIDFLVTGCATKTLDGNDPISGKEYNGLMNLDGNVLMLSVDVSMNKKEKIALIVKTAAIIFKKQNATGFVFRQGNQFITNINDLMDFCYPDSFGLENKCEIYDKKTYLYSFERVTQNYFTPVWDIEEVLNNKSFKTDKELILKEATPKQVANINK